VLRNYCYLDEGAMMPPKSLFTEEMLLDAAFKIVRQEGIKNLSARSLAKELKCSTSPIYTYLESMEEVEKSLRKRATELLLEYQLARRTGQAFFDMGVGYILFAKYEKNLFRFLLAGDYARPKIAGTEQPRLKSALDVFNNRLSVDGPPEKPDVKPGRIMHRNVVEALIPSMKTDPVLTGFDDDQLESVLSKMWVFVHGLAMLINSESVASDNEDTLTQMLHEMGWFVMEGERQKEAGKFRDTARHDLRRQSRRRK
jgi:AcrR family transcriptional regulator